MSEIPSDILQTAGIAAARVLSGFTPRAHNYERIVAIGTDIIAKAILAERERCARIAEGRSKTFDFQKALSDFDDMSYGANTSRSEVALAIRMPPLSPTTNTTLDEEHQNETKRLRARLAALDEKIAAFQTA